MNKKGDVLDMMPLIVGLFGVGVVLVIILGLIAGTTIQNIGASRGQHTGIITSVEYNSNLIWDADLVYFKSDQASSQEEAYCVNNQELKNKLEQFSKTREIVTIKFNNPFILWKSECNGGLSIITEVQQ